MRLYIFLAFLFIFSNIPSFAQLYPDHFGTGNTIGVTITSSPDADSTAAHSLSGTGYLVDTVGAYRFLAQAGFGGDSLQINALLQMGIDDWIDWQMTMPYESFFDRYFTIKNRLLAEMFESELYTVDEHSVQNFNRTQYTPLVFYDKILNDEDILRQKAAFALSQIFVVTLYTGSNNRKQKGDGYAKYYNILYEGAFDNFRNILEDITLNLAMGDYLTYFKNSKEINGVKPDENFAREIMQLFTIGLNELNNDGSPKLDTNGNTIPTYDIEDVEELAKVFTGLHGGIGCDSILFEDCNYEGWTTTTYRTDWNLPMKMDESYHDSSEKILPDLTIINGGQSGMLDIEMALDWLFNHNNVGPFIARRLIQQLVKSNPTPAYINRVATAFNNNGNDIRGDMGAVFKAILLDPEARDCEWISHPHAGKLLQPMERNINLFKAFGVSSPSGKIRFIDYYRSSKIPGEERYTMQAFLKSPSVFNFFSPDYAESEFVDSANLVSPEFEILNSVTSIHYLNRTRDMIERMGRQNHGSPGGMSAGGDNATIDDIYKESPFVNWTNLGTATGNGIIITGHTADEPELDFRKEVCLCKDQDIDALLNHLDLVLCRGQLSDQTKNIIRGNIDKQKMNNVADYQAALPWYSVNPPNLDYTCLDEHETNEFNCLRIVKEMVYLIMLSPDYIILK